MSALAYFCCCGREDETPQPTANLENTRRSPNNIKYEGENVNDSVKLEVAEFKPETPKIHKYPYYCPICFRYFNKMLMTVCCKNYICELCSKDIEEKNQNLNSKCLYCNAAQITLKKVEPDDIIKKYTDSPYIEKVIKATKNPSKSKFSKEITNFTLNDVRKSQKEISIAEILDKTLNSHYQSDGFVKIFPKNTSKTKVVALDSPSEMENEQILMDLRQFKKRLDSIDIEDKIKTIQKPQASKPMRVSRFLSLN